MENINWSRILSVVAALGAAIAGIATYLGEINPKYGLAAVIASTFIAIFTERIQGSPHKKELSELLNDLNTEEDEE